MYVRLLSYVSACDDCMYIIKGALVVTVAACENSGNTKRDPFRTEAIKLLYFLTNMAE